MSSDKASISILSRLMELVKKFGKSVWVFPALLLIVVVGLTLFEVNGSSIGAFRKILYGNISEDPYLIANEARPIRSDEWLVNTQETIAQSQNDFVRINKNIGEGQDMSTVDVPYKDWSTIFKPHNLGFLVLSLNKAFALKWWLMGYLLIISCYFFVLALLPRKRLLASLLALSLFFSTFVQWWYAYGTIGPLYYSLFIAASIIYLCQQDNKKKKLFWSVLLAYLITCFALVLYPPFQIGCGLVLAAFLIGYGIQNYPKWGKKKFLQNTLFLMSAGIVGLAIVGLFIFTRLEVVRTINNTAYPGQRSVNSGTFFPLHFMSSHLGYQFLSEKNTAKYLIDDKNPSNQSETSNFLLLIPFLILPSLFLIYQSYKNNRKVDWPLLGLLALFIIFSLHLFAPSFTPLNKFIMLNKVGDARLLLGMGLLNFFAVTLFIHNYSKTKRTLPSVLIVIYSLSILTIELLLSLRAYQNFDGFISLKRAILFSLPLPLVTYLLLKKYFVWAIGVYLAFSVFISIHVNPLYKGLDVITKDPLSTAVKDLGIKSDKKWISDGGYLENIASINGEPSIAGTYLYPQFNLWSNIPGVQESIYNRYAHVGFQFLDNTTGPTQLTLVTYDSFVVKTPVCGEYLQKLDVGFVISSAVLKNTCAKLQKTISYPLNTLYVYELQF